MFRERLERFYLLLVPFFLPHKEKFVTEKNSLKKQPKMSNEASSLSLARERKAWIGYDFANSCYATVAIATFLPLVLNAYAESEAWQGKLKPKMCSTLDIEYSEKCLECRVGEGNLLCSGASFWFCGRVELNSLF